MRLTPEEFQCPLKCTDRPAHEVSRLKDGTLFLDFGNAAFGTLLLPPREGNWIIHLGEKLDASGRLDRTPGGSIRYLRIEHSGLEARLAIPPDERNTGPGAILMPPEIGEVYPFRYAELEHAAEVDPGGIRQMRVQVAFDEEASAFSSSNPVLDEVWTLCKHTIQATTFCGIYVDGDRERIPYEGDACINQLSHYAVEGGYQIARHTHEYLLHYPTWPTEWQMCSVMMAWMDLLYTGETGSAERFYEILKAKTLIGLARDDGLISTHSTALTREFEESLNLYGERYIFGHGLRDLVDWPPGSFTEGGTGERDNHEMMPVNTVVNAYHAHALILMSRIARVLGKTRDAEGLAARAEKVKNSLNAILFDPDRGVYLDGEGSSHASLHSNMFMLAFGLVPDERKASVVDFVKSRGMACSVYGAQFLLEAMMRNGEEDYALGLMSATHDRSWWNMIQAGSTMAWEAWDLKYKNNLDWNHAWGTAPANILTRFVLGVQPLEPGFARMRVHPRPGSLQDFKGKVPTPRGPVFVEYNREGDQRTLRVDLPEHLEAEVVLDPLPGFRDTIVVNGTPL